MISDSLSPLNDNNTQIVPVAKFVLAPMVDQSELAWRMLCRKHGAQLCFTPMFHALNFVNDPIYRRENFQTCPEDRPLIVQFCANDPEILVKACQLVAPYCDGVDLNLGCPQTIAKRGHYGAFLQDEWPLITELVSSVHKSVNVPISCKIRVFEQLEKTLQYAKMLEEAGCKLLTVHGRTRDQKGRDTGLADWEKIKSVKKALKIPVISNGNVQYYGDLIKCLEETGVDGVMSAEGNLHNPYIFESRDLVSPCWEPSLEYLDMVEKYPCNMSFVRGHLFKVLHLCMLKFPDLRECLATSISVKDCRKVVDEIGSRCKDQHEKFLNDPQAIDRAKLNWDLPFWLCQPYVRPSTSENVVKQNEPENNENTIERRQVLAIKRKHKEEVEKLSEQLGLSKNRAKKLMRFPSKICPTLQPDEQKKVGYNKCLCGNPLSLKCHYNMCKVCCRAKYTAVDTDCEVHKSQRRREVKVET